MRSGWFIQRRYVRPRRHARGCGSSKPASLLVQVSTHTTSSSFTWNFRLQRPGQLMAQWPHVIFSSDSASAGSVAPNRFAPVAAAPPTAARAPNAPVDLTNVRRFMLGMSCIASPFILSYVANAETTVQRALRHGLFLARHERRVPPLLAGFGLVYPPSADLVMKPYRLACPTVSHKTCEFHVCPVHRLSPITVCDSLNPIARYTVFSNRFRILAMQRRNRARKKSARPSATGTFRQANGGAR